VVTLLFWIALAAPGVSSNVLRADYAGSAACADCHPDQYAAWRDSPMRRMTRSGAVEARAPFDGTTLALGPDRATVERRDGEPVVRLAGTVDRVYRVTRVIGGRTREDFVGRPVDDPRAEEMVLPVSYVFRTAEWRYKGYSVLLPERPGLRPGPVWRRSCIFCHNTVPLLSTLYDDLSRDGRVSYQGSVTDRLLPASRLWAVTVVDPAGLGRALADEIRRLDGRDVPPDDVEALLHDAAATTSRRFGPDDFVEVGIGCEACHGGSKAHVADPTVRPVLGVASPLVRAGPADPSPAARVDHVCLRCHTVLFSGYPHAWEDGGSVINSGEARDFQLGGCADALACTDCHDPHGRDDPRRLEALATPARNDVCTRCHEKLADREALRVHAHHDPDGAGGACVACHMPRKNLGLDYRLTRYHRIGRPDDPRRVERDRPLECLLCHADKPVGALVDTMERWWGRRYDRAALRALYGDDLGDGIAATLRLGRPHERAVAAAIAGERGLKALAPLVADVLANERPLVRYFAREALAALAGTRPPLDMTLPGPALRAAGQRWLSEKK
jgi:predicted CXXCH cytochrome family protein